MWIVAVFVPVAIARGAFFPLPDGSVQTVASYPIYYRDVVVMIGSLRFAASVQLGIFTATFYACLLPVGRFLGMAWLSTIGFLLQRSRHTTGQPRPVY